jgi:hypothetical protein
MRTAAGARRTAGGRLTDTRRCIRIGAMIQQGSNGSCIVISHSDHQGGFLRSVVARVHFRAGFEQQSHVLDLRTPHSGHERRDPGGVSEIGIRARSHQFSRNLNVRVCARKSEWSDAIRIGGIDVGFGINQQRYEFQIVGSGRPEQSESPIREFCINIGRAFVHESYGRRALTVTESCGDLAFRRDGTVEQRRNQARQQK